MISVCFLNIFVQRLFFDIAVINLNTESPLYTCLVFVDIMSILANTNIEKLTMVTST